MEGTGGFVDARPRRRKGRGISTYLIMVQSRQRVSANSGREAASSLYTVVESARWKLPPDLLLERA